MMRLSAAAALWGILVLTGGCVGFHRTAELPVWQESLLVEASGLVVLPDSGLRVSHNDNSDAALYLGHPDGSPAHRIALPSLVNRDWEDLALIRREGAPPVVIVGDVGDNAGKYPFVSLHFVEVTPEGRSSRVLGSLPFYYPDGPRDVESLAWDSVNGRVLVLSKRDQPPRLYSVAVPERFAFSEDPKPMEAEFLGEVPGIPPPSVSFILTHPGWGQWSGQPTGMDISPDGRTAVVLTYNDLHLFRREGDESWEQALAREPEILDIPIIGQTEGIAFTGDGSAVLIIPEGVNPPLLRVDLP